MTLWPLAGTNQDARWGSKRRGVWPGVVVDNKDGGSNPGYRIKVKLPWLNEHETTFWARLAVPMAGPGRGTYVLPEIDDQVLVVFEHGDINRPIVIGTLWSKKQEPVEVNESGRNNTKLIKSRCGHRIIFDDKDGAEKIVIVDKTRKNKIVLDSVNKVIKIESDGDIDVIAKANVIMHSNALKVGTSEGLTGKGRSLLTHSAKTFGLKASSGITIGGGNTTINTSNAAATNVSGSGVGELGGMAAETANDQVEASEAGRARSPSSAGGSATPGAAARGSGPPPAGVALLAQPAMTSPSRAKLTFVELKLVDTDGEPVPFARYCVTCSDGAVYSGALDAQGHARVDGIPEGMCKVTFPGFHGDDWSTQDG